MIKIEEGSGNVYADLGMADADEMMIKAQLATKIGEIIKGHKWSQQQAADRQGNHPARPFHSRRLCRPVCIASVRPSCRSDARRRTSRRRRRPDAS